MKEEERNYIHKYKYKDEDRYRLVIPAFDTHKHVYIRSGNNLGVLREIRDELLSKKYSEAELHKVKKQYRRHVKEPRIEHHIQKRVSGHYTIFKNNKTYGTYHTIEEARKIRDKLIQHEWNEAEAGVKIQRRDRLGKNRYIYKENGKYYIKRVYYNEDGSPRVERFESSIPTLEEARQLRDWWEEANWDWENIDLI